jgi:hypothetical protein
MPLFHHQDPDDPAGDADGSQAAAAQGPDYDAALRHFTALPVPQRAAEVLAGISPMLGQSRSGMDQLLGLWCPVSLSGLAADDPPRPDGWWALRHVLLEAFQALELSRLVMRQEDTTNHWGTVTGYELSPGGKAALERGDVAAVVARRLPD